jgi:hypothetical protein
MAPRTSPTNGAADVAEIDDSMRISYSGNWMIRSLCVLLILFSMMPCAISAQEGSATPMSLETDLRAVSGFFPRPEGSPQEKALLAWIRGRLASMGLAFTPFDFSQSDFQHSFSSCLRVDVPGASRDSLIVAVPLNTPPGAAAGQDGSVNIALALDLLSRARGSTPPLGLSVLFLGAEFGDTDAYPMGSTLFLRDFQPDYRAAVLYLNLREVPARVLVRGGGRGIVTPYWLMNRSVDALRQSGVDFRLQGDETQIFRMGTTNERTSIEPFLKAGYPSVGLAGEYNGVHRQDQAEWLASFSTFLSKFLAAGAGGISEEWDRHYLLLQMSGLSLIVREKVYVAALLGTLAATLLYSLVFRRGLKKYLRTLARNFPAILPLVALSFIFLAAGTYAIRLVLSLRRFPELWTYAPLAFFIFKVGIAVFLYTSLYNLFRRLPFPRNGSFYSAASLFFLLVDIGVVAVFNISFTFYFLWAFIFVFLSAVVPNRFAKAALFLPAPFWGIRGLLTVFTAPALPFCQFLLLSPLWGNLLAAVVCLPFILFLLRLGLVFPGRGIMRRRVRELIFAGVLLAAGGYLATRLATFSPFSASHRQPVSAVQTLDVASSGVTVSTSLDIESPGPLGALAVTDAQGWRVVDPSGTSVVMKLPTVASPVQIRQDSSQFLEERNVNLHIDMPSSPRELSVSLTSDDDFILFDSSFPSIRVSPREYRLLVGAFPPNPMDLQLTLPADGTFTVTFTIDFDSPLLETTIAVGPDAQVNTRVRVVRSLGVKT